MVDFLFKGQTITGQYYDNLLRKLREEIKRKRPGMLTKGVLFHQDNAPAHTSAVSMAQIHRAALNWYPIHPIHRI